MSKAVEHYRPVMIDAAFLQPLIDAYKVGLFDTVALPMRVRNALDSLAEYGDVRSTIRRPL
jgi:hypothetical protein